MVETPNGQDTVGSNDLMLQMHFGEIEENRSAAQWCVA